MDQSLYAEVIRVQVRALEAIISSLTTPSLESPYTPSTSESLYESSSELTMAEARLSDFKMCGTFDGESNAARWLTKLLYDFERAGHSHSPPAMYLRAIDMLFEGKAATWLDSNPRVRALGRLRYRGYSRYDL